jgi:hypothetical protein
MSVLILLFGSVGLLLYGTQLTDGLQRIAGERLRWLLTSLARNRLFALASAELASISTHPLLSSRIARCVKNGLRASLPAFL